MIRLLLSVLLVGLTGCAALNADRAPGCAGARRLANPHGSILAPEAAQPAGPAGQCQGDPR